MPPVQDQYKIGPEIMEIQDPTFEQEEAYRISRLPPEPVIPMGKINRINCINLERLYLSLFCIMWQKFMSIGEEEEEAVEEEEEEEEEEDEDE